MGLKVVRVIDGGVDDQTGQVEFIFRYQQHGKIHASMNCRNSAAKTASGCMKAAR
ncbi:hypothetical protein [Chromatium okenii]|uniref:hypothetical protein n=1 Tax=Chromatium okenii TaxID=61644 RepID=UPI0018D50AA3|nr:hypothetical protein [Chromatium okenii]